MTKQEIINLQTKSAYLDENKKKILELRAHGVSIEGILKIILKEKKMTYTTIHTFLKKHGLNQIKSKR